ncbi:MAG: cold shock domain-containing protein [Cocleimonas sp.]|nr:cold shock domain-containing protein [Cocleimonas sp.]
MKGKLKHWNEEKGFGFICLNDKSKDIFIHISALSKMSRRPAVGDIILFEKNVDNNGKERAINAQILGVFSTSLRIKNKKEKANSNLLLKVFLGGVLVIIGFGASKSYFKQDQQAVVSNMSMVSNVTASEKSRKIINRSKFICQGLEHCSQMSSCAEAKFYLRNCPNTKMDGDNDGVPCETQWCN